MDSIVEKVKAHSLDLLKNSRCETMPFHNVQHTLEVYGNVQTIGKYEAVNEKEMQILKIAALFHDTGFSEVYIGHEAISAKNAEQFLHKINYSQENIENVVNCITATKMPQQPNSKLDRIICDADLFHLASSQYLIKNCLLRKEWALYLNLEYTDAQWEKLNITFLKNHKFHTKYGKLYLAYILQVNIAKREAEYH